MNTRLKSILTNWKVILLLVLIVLALISIQPKFFGNEGVVIRNVVTNSSASNGGIENPSSRLTPLSKERIISINGEKVFSVEDYFTITSDLKSNQSVKLETSQRIYTLVTHTDQEGEVDLGLKVSEAPLSNLRKGLDLEGGTRVLLKPSEPVAKEDLELIISNLKERLNVFGLSDIVVRGASDLAGDEFILIEIAGITEEEVKDLLAKQGKFEAKIGNQTVFFGGRNDIPYVCRSADCSGIDPRRGCSATPDGTTACGFFFTITLSPEAAERHAKITEKLSVISDGSGAYLSEDLALLLDDVEVDRLKIGAELKGRASTNIQISGSGTGRTQTEALANTLDSMKKLQTVIITGSLPVKLDVVKMDTISPSLGKEFMNNIFLVGFLVILSVIAVILIRYRKLKIAIPMILTLLSEMVLILGFAALVGWNLDLAAIAGIIITAGTGVDHLIIITDETIRGEEISDWKRRIRNAMFMVMGAYLTTLSGMLPLLWAGAGLLKGFALTTIAGFSFGVLFARPAYAVVIEKLLK